jgi:hypothetical protein
MLDDAVSARVSQADEKGWKSFTKDIDKNIRMLVSPPSSDTTKRTTKDLGEFFSKLKAAKGKYQKDRE